MRPASVALFLVFAGGGYLATTNGWPMRSSARAGAPADRAVSRRTVGAPMDASPPPSPGASVAQSSGSDALMAYLSETLPLTDAERWTHAIELASSLRVYRFEALEQCPEASELDRGWVRVRWSAASNADGLVFTKPEILSTVPSAWKTCALDVLREGLKVTSAEIEGPLPIVGMTLVVAVPVVVPPEIRAQIGAAEQQIAENLRAGRPPLKAAPMEPPATAP